MKNIIVPTDFSSPAENALNYAVELAKVFNSRITLVHAYPYPSADYETGFTMPVIPGLKEHIEKRLEDTKAEILKNNEKSLTVDTYTQIGSPFEVISKVSSDDDVDLIVMGITGEAGRLKEHIVGSTAVKVARHINTPTFIIPENVKYKPITKISFACDLDKTEDTDLVYVAKYFSELFKASLDIIYVENPEGGITIEKSKTSHFIEKKLRNINHHTVHVLGDDVGMSLKEIFNSEPIDVVMINPKQHNLFYYLFHKSITNELAFHLKLPILAIH